MLVDFDAHRTKRLLHLVGVLVSAATRGMYLTLGQVVLDDELQELVNLTARKILQIDCVSVSELYC